MNKTYNLRLFLNREQKDKLLELSNIRIDIWNTFNDIQANEYKANNKIFSNYDLHKQATLLKKNDKIKWNKFNSKACQRIITELCDSWKSYLSLKKKDPKAKYPNNIENDKYRILVFNQSGWVIQENFIIINKIQLKYKSQFSFQQLKNMNIKEIRIKFKNNKWICDFVVQENDQYIMNIENKVLALDLGLKTLAVGIDNEENVIIIHNKIKKIKKYFSKQIDKIKSKLSKKIKGSSKYEKLNKVKKKLYSRQDNQIKQTLHIQSKKLSNMDYDVIVVGDLNIKKPHAKF